jgi:hypothetical protein
MATMSWADRVRDSQPEPLKISPSLTFILDKIRLVIRMMFQLMKERQEHTLSPEVFKEIMTCIQRFRLDETPTGQTFENEIWARYIGLVESPFDFNEFRKREIQAEHRRLSCSRTIEIANSPPPKKKVSFGGRTVHQYFKEPPSPEDLLERQERKQQVWLNRTPSVKKEQAEEIERTCDSKTPLCFVANGKLITDDGITYTVFTPQFGQL